MFPGRPKRLAHFAYLGPWRYSLTFCTSKKHAAFKNAEIVDALAAQTLRTCDEQAFELLAYCFMPDHLHLLMQGLSAVSNLKSCCHLLRQRLAHAYAQQGHGRLWQPGYYDRILRNEERTEECVRYILANPVRAGLVGTVEEYPFIGGTWWAELKLGATSRL